jgi:hypothetical protein
MKPDTPPIGTPEAKALGCTCGYNPQFDNGKNKHVFIPLTCALHNQFHQPPTEDHK